MATSLMEPHQSRPDLQGRSRQVVNQSFGATAGLGVTVTAAAGQTIVVEGDPVWRYLAGRGIDLARLAKVPHALRYHPELYCAEAAGPLMTAVERLPTVVASGEFADIRKPPLAGAAS